MIQLKFFASKKNLVSCFKFKYKMIFKSQKNNERAPPYSDEKGLDLSFENSCCQKKNKNQGYFFQT